jgi:1-acyl-sn-glycerol-3-phosphate acyltransferase
MRLLWKWYLKVSGWNTNITFPFRDLKKYIIIIAPHTSNWDFIIGVAYRSLLGLNNVKFLGKHELFKFPFGILFRSIGGIPADRHHRSNLVDEVAGLFRYHHEFVIALSPEGTRRRVEKLRTGFYYIATQANVPIVMIALDWKHRTLVFDAPFIPSVFEHDMEKIFRFYRGIEGKYPANGLMHK